MRTPEPTERVIATKRYSYVFSKYQMAIATVSTGETVVIQTDDAFGSQVHSEADLPSTVNKWPYVNPQTGPTLIEGARAGDTLRVEILSIEPARDYVVSAFIPGLGGLVPSDNTPMLSKDLDEKVFIYRLDEDGVHFSENIVLPYAPFLGTIATAPELEAVSTISPGDFGGNMDVPDIGPGALIRLPISVDGAFFFIGDAHAAQGDGELCGAACEMPARVRLRFELEPGQAIPLPEIETEQEVMVVGSARPLEDAVRRASSYLVELMVARYGFDSATAYQLLTHAGRLRVGNIVNPRYSVAARIAKAFLPPRRAGVARLGEVTSG